MQVKCKAVLDGIAWFALDEELPATQQTIDGDTYYFVTKTIVGTETFTTTENGVEMTIPTPPAGDFVVKLPEALFTQVFNIL